jgi:hypothetical protein
MSDLGLDFTSLMLPILLFMFFLFAIAIILLVKEIRGWIIDAKKFLKQRTIKKEGKERSG